MYLIMYVMYIIIDKPTKVTFLHLEIQQSQQFLTLG